MLQLTYYFQRCSVGSSSEKKDSSELISWDDLHNLEISKRKMLISLLDANFDMNCLRGLISIGGADDEILPVLIRKLEKAAKTHDVCEIEKILVGLKDLADKNTKFSEQDVALIETLVIKNPIGCGSSLKVPADDGAEILKLIKKKQSPSPSVN